MIKPIEFTAVFFKIEAMINDTPKQICQRVELGLFVTKNLQLQPDINPLHFYDKQAQLHRLENLICFSLCVYLPHSIFKSFKVKHCIILKEYKNYQVGVSNVSCIAGLVACIAGLEGERKEEGRGGRGGEGGPALHFLSPPPLPPPPSLRARLRRLNVSQISDDTFIASKILPNLGSKCGRKFLMTFSLQVKYCQVWVPNVVGNFQ